MEFEYDVNQTVENVTSNLTITDVTKQPNAGWFILTIMIMLIFVSVITNAGIIYVFLKDRSLIKEPFNIYLLNLAISDFLCGAVSMPQFTANTYLGYWPFSYRQCTFWIFIDNLTTSESLIGLMVIALDRLWAVSMPVSYRHYNSVRKVTIICVLTWVYTILAFSPGMFYNRAYPAYPPKAYGCDWEVTTVPKWAGSFHPLIATIWVPFWVTCLAYPITVFFFWRLSVSHNRVAVARTEKKEADEKKNSRYQKEKKVFFLLTLLFICLMVCWVPGQIFLMMTYLFSQDLPIYFLVAYWMAYAMSALNPFLFHIGSDQVRKAVNRVIFRSLSVTGTRTGKSTAGTTSQASDKQQN